MGFRRGVELVALLCRNMAYAEVVETMLSAGSQLGWGEE